MYNEGHAEAVSNWDKYQKDEQALTNLNNALQNNGQTITDNAERQKIADKTLKNASERAKEYGNQIVANTKTLSDFKKENEVEDPNKQVKPKFTDGLKSFASSALSSIGNAVVSAGTAMIAQQLISWGLQGIDAIVHWNDNIIAKGKEAKETILEQNQTYKDQKSQLEELQEQYTKYASGVKISGNIIKNATLSDEDFQAFLDTSNQIANLAPSMIDGWDSEGNAILKFGTDTKEANQQISDYIQLQRDVTHLSVRDNLQDEYKGVVKDVEKTGKEISNKKDQKKEADTITSGWTALKNATETDGPITFTTTAPQKEVEELLDKYKVTSLITSDVNGDTYTVDMSELSAADKNALKTSLESKEALAQGNANLIESEKLAQEAVQASKWKDLLPSLQAYVESSNMFDNMDSDVAERAKNGINTMLSNIDISKMTDQIKDAGGIDDWIDKTLIAPMTSGSKDVQKAWADLFSLEDSYGSEDSKMTVGEWSKQRNDYLKTISEGTGESFDSLAKKLGYKTDEGWTVREQINNAAARLYGKNYDRDQRAEIGSYLNGLTKDNYEIAIDLLINGDKAFSSLDEFKEKVNEAISNAKNQADEAAVSLDSMETKVSTAKSTLSSMGTILTETTSAGGISKDNVKILSTAFKDVKDPRGIEQNVNDLFTTTSDGIKLNIDALKTFTEYQAEATDGDFEKGIKLQTKAIKDQTDVTNKAKKAWEEARGTEDEDDKKAAYDSEKDKLKDARNEYLSYMQSQSEWQATKKQQQELLSYYSQWQRAQSTENAGDKYNNIVAGLKNAKDAYDKGLVGTDDFKSFAALISPTGSDDRANFAENYGKAVRYLTEDKTGVNNFLADLKSKGMASYDDASKRWSFDIDNMSKAARSMGISKEFMSANFGRLRDYGIDNNFISSIEEGIDRTQELTSALSDEQKRLEELKNTDSTNTTAISASEDKVNKYKQDLKETYDNMESYSEDAAQNAIDNFNSSAMGAQAYEEEIKRVQKNDQLTNDQRNAAINQLKAKQEELAASAGTTVEALLGTDVSSLMDGIITDSASVTTALDGINKAYEEQNTDVTSLVDTLGKYTSEQLEGIDFNDGKWDTELGDAEKAVESLCEKLGLTKDQARSVIEALKEAGKLKDSEESSDSSKETTKGSWEKPQTAEQMGFGDDPDRTAEYTHSLEALTAAHKENDAATEKSFETLSKYNRTQLEGIKLNDGAYNVEGMEQAEDAIQQLADKTQLSKDQILTALEGLGVLKVNAPTMDATKGLEDLVSEAKDAQDELSDLTGKTYTFDFDTTDLDTAHKQVADLQEEVNKYRDRDGKYHPEITGGEQVQSMYKAAIAQEQNAEYSSSAIGQSSLSSDVVQAAQDFMQAKNEMDQQSITVNYVKGEEPEKADDIEGKANFTLGEHPTKAPDISGTANYSLGSYPKTAPTIFGTAVYTKKIQASGTMTSVAHASGTAYNVLNMKPLSSAHAKGEVALKHDEQALVNEVGINGHSESIVRDGVWSLIPGGAHIENLKKGDIIFSATQTEDLLKHGATHGHARAYAQGTASGVSLAPAYADGTSELDDTIKKVSTQAKDWIETALDRLERIVEKYQDIAESDYSNYKSSEKNYDKALKNLNKQLQTQKDSRAKYVAKANEVASAVGLSDELKKKVQNGTINIESLSEDDKKRVDAYQEWYEKILDCDKAIRELTKSQKDLAKAKVERVIEAYDTVIGKRENKADYYKAKQELRISQGYNQKPGSKYEKYMKKELYYTNEQKRLTDKEIKEYKGRMKEYLKVNGHKTVDPEYQKMKKQLYSLQTEAVKLENEAAELVQALQDNREQIKQWAVDRWDRAGSKQDAVIDYAKANDNPEYQINEKIYQERIKSNARQINALQKLRAEKAEYYDTHFSSMNNEEAQKYLNSIAQIDEQILKIGSDIENLKNEIMELRWKPFDDAQDKLSNVITEYQTMQKLLGDAESFYNDDGSFTTNGLTNILLTQESIDATKQKIANYREGLNKLEEQYKNGCYSLDEYNEKSKQLLDGIQQESTALSELKQNMLDMYETQIKKENDLLQENIDKRKDALSAKEKYYDYDKTLKKKSKDINTLKSQIAALEGTSNAAAKARLEKLRAELADAEDDMADTMHQHEVDMKNTGYENFSNEANKALDNTLDAVKKNSSFQEAIISGMLTNVTTNYDNTYKHLHTVMDQYGVKVSSTFDTMIGKSADFNTSLIQQIKALETISNMKVTLPYGTSNGQGGSTTGNNTYTGAENGIHNTFNSNKDSTGAGNETPGTVNNKKYSLKLNATDIYLTYDHIKQQLKATWSPSKPEHSDIEWKSSDESIAKVSSDGTVRGVSSGLDKNGLMARDESKTRKCIITAIGGGGLAKATCTVHVMPNAHYEAIKSYAANAGIDVTSGDNLRAAMQYAYQNGANHSYQSDVAVEGFKKAYLKDWTSSLPNRPDGATDIPSGVSQLVGYFNSKGKKVGPKEMQQLADILGISTPGVKKYDSWGSALKNQILQKYKSYGFATGGIINKLIPADMSTLLGKAIISNGDQGFIGAKVGESVMTEEFTRLLKPSIAAMNNFTNMFNPVTPTATNNDYTINNEVNINVANMSNDLDIQDVANKVSTIINKNMTRDWRKLR